MLTISLLGEQVIDEAAAGPVRTRSSRTIALVGYLVIHAGTPQSRQRISGLFWPDSTDAQALTNLRRELHHLRQLLGEDESLQVTPADLCWHDTETCDVDVRALDRAYHLGLAASGSGDVAALVRHAGDGIDAYGGDFLPTVYDDWAVVAREDLRRRCVELCDLLADLGAHHVDLRRCLDAARKRIALEPLEETGYLRLMGLQAETGDRAGAISTYHHCASVLERELGVSPGAAIRRALDGLIGADVPVAPTARPRVRAPARTGVARIPMVGRDGPLAVLTDEWERAVAGHTRIGLVRGPPGVGKSRLVAELADRVRGSGGSVAAAQCFDSSGRLALAPVADWLRTPALRAASRALEPVWRQEVERLVPDADPVAAASAGDRAMVDAWQRHRFFEGLTRAFLNVDRPLLLLLDNLQWCDPETLAWISFVIGLAPDHRLMLALTLRDNDPSGERVAGDWARRLRAGGYLTDVALVPLDPADTGALTEALTGRTLSGSEIGLLHATTGGFPLYVIEVNRAATGHSGPAAPADGLPTGELGSVLRRRLEQASTDAQDTAGLAAAFGRNFTLDLLTEASDLDADAVARAVDELWRSRIVSEVGAGYDFSHDLLRDAAYRSISPPRRWLLHRRLAQALELSSPVLGDDAAGQLAEQYDRGGRPERALPYYRRAAEIAARRFAHTDATRLHRQALRMIEALPAGRDRDQRELDSLLAMTAPLNALHGYASLELQPVLERAVELSEQTGSRAKLVNSLVALWACRFVQGHIREAHRISSRALSVPDVDDVLLGQAHFAFAGSAVTLGLPRDALEHFDIAHDRCAGAESLAVGTMPEVHSLAWSAHAHWLLGQHGHAVDHAREAIERARAIRHPYSLAVALAYAGVTAQLLDDRDGLGRTVAELRELCERYGFAYYREWGVVLDGWLRGGATGIALMKQGIAQLRDEGSLVRMPYWLALLAEGMSRNGMAEGALAALDSARTAAESRGDTWWLPEVLRMRAALSQTAQGDALLGSALTLAEQQGSKALADRCRHDLERRPAASKPPFGPADPEPNAARTLPS
ncbi:MAG TPA: AAA family ATPase [Nocardioidaceae bacterium]|nr:AAA family ATPase [Nocardioidaceae bacterium]